MEWGRAIAASFSMTDDVWKRHTNPWSAWTRIPLIVLFAFAVWSRIWIGIWALVPIAILLVWTWINPRAFPPPESTDNWTSKGVLGERVWLNRAHVPIPKHHRIMALLLSGISLAGLPFFIWGLYALEIWPTILGICLILFGKLWFIDRMVWLYEDMKDASPEYRRWLY